MTSIQKTSRLIVFGSICLAILGVVGTFFMSPHAGVTNPFSVQLRTGAALLVAVTSFGGSVLFLGGLGHFKTHLKIAYTLFATGIMLFGIALLQLPIIGFLNLWNSWWANDGPVIVPFVFATLLIYAGIRRFALLLAIKGRLTSWGLVTGTAIAATIIGFITGHDFARYRSLQGTDIYIAIVAWAAVFITYAALLSRQIINRIGPRYQDAMRWLAVALGALTIAAWHELTINYFMNNDSWYVAHGVSFWPFMVSGLLVLRAGYSFAVLETTVPVIPLEQVPKDIVDVAYARTLASIAGLASEKDNPAVTGVASTLAQAPTKEQLVSSYSKLESYLVNEDPLRTYGREELRSKLHPRFRALLERRGAHRQQN